MPEIYYTIKDRQTKWIAMDGKLYNQKKSATEAMEHLVPEGHRKGFKVIRVMVKEIE